MLDNQAFPELDRGAVTWRTPWRFFAARQLTTPFGHRLSQGSARASSRACRCPMERRRCADNLTQLVPFSILPCSIPCPAWARRDAHQAPEGFGLSAQNDLSTRSTDVKLRVP